MVCWRFVVNCNWHCHFLLLLLRRVLEVGQTIPHPRTMLHFLWDPSRDQWRREVLLILFDISTYYPNLWSLVRETSSNRVTGKKWIFLFFEDDEVELCIRPFPKSIVWDLMFVSSARLPRLQILRCAELHHGLIRRHCVSVSWATSIVNCLLIGRVL